MSFGNRRDFTNRKLNDRLLRPHVTYPSTCIEDKVIVEDVLVDPDYTPLIPGTLRDGFSKLVLVDERPVEGNEAQQYMRRTWATNTRLAQDDEDLVIRYQDGCLDYPIYIRNYIIRGDTYTAATEGAPLTAVTSLTLTAAGSNYSRATVSITGGSGSGATGTAQIRDGKIVAVQVTNGGAGYVTAPTVAIEGDGTGATATAQIQPQTALLVEETSEPAPNPLGKVFNRVTRIYMTLPGPLLAHIEDDGETNTPAWLGRQSIATPTLPLSRVITTFATTAVSIAGETITIADHGLPNGLAVRFTSTTTLPSPLAAATDYWIINRTASTFQLATTSAGSAINMADTGTGTHSILWGSGTRLSYQPKTCAYGTKVSSSLLAWDAITVTATENGDYTTPALVLGFNNSPALLEARDGTGRVILDWNKVPSKSRKALITTTMTYGPSGAATATLSPIYMPTLRELDYTGVHSEFHFSRVLNNAFSYFESSGTENPKWPYVVTPVSFADSSPNVTDYLSQMSSGRIVNSKLALWKYGIYRVVNTTVQLI